MSSYAYRALKRTAQAAATVAALATGYLAAQHVHKGEPLKTGTYAPLVNPHPRDFIQYFSLMISKTPTMFKDWVKWRSGTNTPSP